MAYTAPGHSTLSPRRMKAPRPIASIQPRRRYWSASFRETPWALNQACTATVPFGHAWRTRFIFMLFWLSIGYIIALKRTLEGLLVRFNAVLQPVNSHIRMDLNFLINGSTKAGEQETSTVYSTLGRIFQSWGWPNARKPLILWWPGRELNPRHADFQSAALPTELPGLLQPRIRQARARLVN